MKAIIVGGGQVGSYIANLLLENDYSVKIIENRENVIQKLKRDFPLNIIIHGNGTDPTVLETAGIVGTDVIVAVTGEDETNLVASTIAKFEFGIPRVIARVNNPKNAWLFDSGMGVDVGINQADLMAHLIVEEIDFKNVLTLIKMKHGAHSIIQVNVDGASDSVNKAIKDLQIPLKGVLIAIYRGKDVIIPRGDIVIQSGDRILAFADTQAQASINSLFGPRN